VRPALVAANWKMNGSRAASRAWAGAFRAAAPACEVVVFPPAVYLGELAGLLEGAAQLGAQDLSVQAPGAWTGDTAGEMLADAGAAWVIVGHSERRAHYGETDAVVAAKVRRALDLGLRPIVCVGENLAERDAGREVAHVLGQLDAVLASCTPAELARGALAYEPVWAIGTGRAASAEQAQQMHAALRGHLAARDPAAAAKLRLLYGGSVKPDNAASIFAQADVDGGLIGGASLDAAAFVKICAAARA
jgi:triosephosphate isomerase